MKKILILCIMLNLIACTSADVTPYADFNNPSDVVEKSDFIFIGKITEKGYSNNGGQVFVVHEVIFMLNKTNQNNDFEIQFIDDYVVPGRLEEVYNQYANKYTLFIGKYDNSKTKLVAWSKKVIPDFDPELELDEQAGDTKTIYWSYYELIHNK